MTATSSTLPRGGLHHDTRTRFEAAVSHAGCRRTGIGQRAGWHLRANVRSRRRPSNQCRSDPIPSSRPRFRNLCARRTPISPDTKALLAEQPSLLNATWDWGGGDFETGLGGAGHMGNREIAEFLIGQGARLDIFVATMLGRWRLSAQC